MIPKGNAKYICPHLRVLVCEVLEYASHSPASRMGLGIQQMLNLGLLIHQLPSTLYKSHLSTPHPLHLPII